MSPQRREMNEEELSTHSPVSNIPGNHVLNLADGVNEREPFRVQFGALENGVLSTVVHPSRFQTFIDRNDQINKLRDLCRENHSSIKWLEKTQTCTVYSTEKALEIQTGSEAQVYVGLFIDKSTESNQSREHLRRLLSSDAEQVREVAVKVYPAWRRDAMVKSERDLINIVSETGGVVAYLDDIEEPHNQIFVQELGAIDLHKNTTAVAFAATDVRMIASCVAGAVISGAVASIFRENQLQLGVFAHTVTDQHRIAHATAHQVPASCNEVIELNWSVNVA